MNRLGFRMKTYSYISFQNKNLSKGSFMIYLVEDGNTYEMEQAEYSVTQLWSDIGGAGG